MKISLLSLFHSFIVYNPKVIHLFTNSTPSPDSVAKSGYIMAQNW